MPDIPNLELKERLAQVIGALEIRKHLVENPPPKSDDWVSHRFMPHATSDDQLKYIREARQKYRELALLVKSQWPEAARIVDKLEEASMLTIAAIARY